MEERPNTAAKLGAASVKIGRLACALGATEMRHLHEEVTVLGAARRMHMVSSGALGRFDPGTVHVLRPGAPATSSRHGHAQWMGVLPGDVALKASKDGVHFQLNDRRCHRTPNLHSSLHGPSIYLAALEARFGLASRTDADLRPTWGELAPLRWREGFAVAAGGASQ